MGPGTGRRCPQAFVRDPGPDRRLAEGVVGLPGPAPPCVGEVGLDLAALGLGGDLGPVFPEQLADGVGAAPQGADRGASEAARERRAFGPVAASQLAALAGAVGAQLADRRTARRGRGGAVGGVRLGPRGLVGSPFAAAALDLFVLGDPLTLHLAVLPFDQLRSLRALAGRGAGGSGRPFAGPLRHRPRVQPHGGRAGLVARHSALAAAALEAAACRPRLAPFDACGHDDAAVVALVLLGPAAEPARGALDEVDGSAGLGVDAADGDVDVRAGRVGVGGADRVVAVVETEAVERAGDGRQHLLLRRGRGALGPAQHDVGVWILQLAPAGADAGHGFQHRGGAGGRHRPERPRTRQRAVSSTIRRTRPRRLLIRPRPGSGRPKGTAGARSNHQRNALRSRAPARSHRERNQRRACAAVWSSTPKCFAMAFTKRSRSCTSATLDTIDWYMGVSTSASTRIRPEKPANPDRETSEKRLPTLGRNTICGGICEFLNNSGQDSWQDETGEDIPG